MPWGRARTVASWTRSPACARTASPSTSSPCSPRKLAKHPQKLYRFYQREDFDYIQLIPCLPGLDDTEDEYSLTPELFASFYKAVFRLWVEEFPARPVPVRHALRQPHPAFRRCAPAAVRHARRVRAAVCGRELGRRLPVRLLRARRVPARQHRDRQPGRPRRRAGARRVSLRAAAPLRILRRLSLRGQSATGTASA